MINKTSFRVPIYPAWVFLYVGDTVQEVVEPVSSKFLIAFENDLTHVDGYTLNRDSCFIIMIKRGAPYTRYVTHECMHVVHKILEYAGVKSDFGNDEAECYLMSWLCEKVVAEITKMSKKNKEKKRVKAPAKEKTNA